MVSETPRISAFNEHKIPKITIKTTTKRKIHRIEIINRVCDNDKWCLSANLMTITCSPNFVTPSTRR